MRKTLLFSIIILSLACKSKKKEIAKKESGPALVDVIVAATSSLSNTVEANGSVIADESLQIFPEVGGRLIYLNIPEGARVSAGTILARINDADLKAQIQKSKVQLDLAQITEQRLKKLVTIKGINQADYDAALNLVNSLKADIQITQATLAKTVIRAPFSGIVGLKQVSPGAFVTTQTPLVTLQKTDKLKIDFTVPELYGNLIKKGAIVKITTNDSSSNTTATILAIEPEINTNTRNLKVRATLNGKPLNPGTFVKVMVDAGSSKNSIVIPTNAIIPDARSKQLVVVKGGKGKFVNVETGLRTANGVEITKGINVGDTVVVTGVLFVRANSPVKIKSVKKVGEVKDN